MAKTDSSEEEDRDIKFRVLNELGLNDYESRAYLTVLETGIAVAREISDRSGIPYAKVYQVLDNLISKQLLIGDESRPKKFSCKNPSEAFQDRLDNLNAEWTKSHKKRVDLIKKEVPGFEELFKHNKQNIEEEQGVWTVVGLTNIMSRILKLVNKTNSKIRIITNDPDLIVTKLPKVDKSVTIEVKTNIEHKAITKIADKVHIVDNIGDANVMIFDDFAHFNIVAKNKGKFSKGEYIGVLTQIKELVQSSIIEFY